MAKKINYEELGYNEIKTYGSRKNTVYPRSEDVCWCFKERVSFVYPWRSYVVL